MPTQPQVNNSDKLYQLWKTGHNNYVVITPDTSIKEKGIQDGYLMEEHKEETKLMELVIIRQGNKRINKDLKMFEKPLNELEQKQQTDKITESRWLFSKEDKNPKVGSLVQLNFNRSLLLVEDGSFLSKENILYRTILTCDEMKPFVEKTKPLPNINNLLNDNTIDGYWSKRNGRFKVVKEYCLSTLSDYYIKCKSPRAITWQEKPFLLRGLSH